LLFTLFYRLIILFYNVFKLARVDTILMRHSSLFSRVLCPALLFLRQLFLDCGAINCLFCFLFLNYLDFFGLFFLRLLIKLFLLPLGQLFLPYFLSLFFLLLSLLFFLFFLFVSHFFNLGQYDLLCLIFLNFFLFVLLLRFPGPVIEILLFLFRACYFRFLILFFLIFFFLCDSDKLFSCLRLVNKLLGLIIKRHFYFQQLHLIFVFFALKVILKLPFFFERLVAGLTRVLVNDDLLVDAVFLVFLYLFCELLPVLAKSFLLKKPFFLFSLLKFLLLLLFN